MIELTPQQQQFIDTQIALGIFKEPADVVGTALELFVSANASTIKFAQQSRRSSEATTNYWTSKT